MLGLDFENSQWVRVYVDDGPDFAALDWQARAVAEMLWRKVNRFTGRLPYGKLGPAAAIAAKIGVPRPVVEETLPDLMAVGGLALDEASREVFFPDFTKAMDAHMSDAARAKRYRDKTRVTPRDATVTPREPSRDDRHAPSRPVTPRDLDEKRGEEKQKPNCVPAHVREGASAYVPAREAPLCPEAKAILEALHEHPSLAEATPELANQLWGQTMGKGVKPEWVLDALHKVGRRADAARAEGQPWVWSFTRDRLVDAAAWAKAPTPAAGGFGRAPSPIPRPGPQVPDKPFRAPRPPPQTAPTEIAPLRANGEPSR